MQNLLEAEARPVQARKLWDDAAVALKQGLAALDTSFDTAEDPFKVLLILTKSRIRGLEDQKSIIKASLTQVQPGLRMLSESGNREGLLECKAFFTQRVASLEEELDDIEPNIAELRRTPATGTSLQGCFGRHPNAPLRILFRVVVLAFDLLLG